MNNKGFAVSTILYGLVVLMGLLLFLAISTAAFQRNTDDNFVKDVEEELNTCTYEGTC